MRGRPDPDLLLVEAMLAPPPLEEARRSLEYWERRRRELPVYRRAARREARELAERVQFESSVLGRILNALGLSYVRFVRPTKRGLFAFAWMLVPRRIKVVALGLVATWLVVIAAVLVMGAALYDRVA